MGEGTRPFGLYWEEIRPLGHYWEGIRPFGLNWEGIRPLGLYGGELEWGSSRTKHFGFDGVLG